MICSKGEGSNLGKYCEFPVVLIVQGTTPPTSESLLRRDININKEFRVIVQSKFNIKWN
jgi:hypothetical protein